MKIFIGRFYFQCISRNDICPGNDYDYDWLQIFQGQKPM